ncbi:MAG: epoxide hydrolase family protein [Actinomycetota bacterium]
MTAMAKPFTIAIDDEVLDDLRRRLVRTRWPEAETVDDWSQGVPLAYVEEVCRYWADEYDWRATEAMLNELDHEIETVDGLDIHLVHARSPEPDALPLVITHGWPGSVVEFLDVIGPLSDPRANGGDPGDAFHVICPSLPGFGFSGKPERAGWGIDRVADAWITLMQALGYDRWGAQGGDWGSAVTTAIGGRSGSGCIGIHVNMPRGRPGPGDEPIDDVERNVLAALAHYQEWDSGYSKQQATRPQTLGYGLTDSPAGQAAWILEKFWAWTDCGHPDGHPENAIARDRLLDNIMLYWLNAAATSSARLYWESFGRHQPDPVVVPTGVAAFPKEILPSSPRWSASVYPDIRRWTEMERGGHFAAMEQPELFVDDVRAFFRELR